MGIITGLSRTKGFMKIETFDLIITPGRLVFALITQKMINDAIRQVQAESKRQGKGLLAQIGAQMAYWDVIEQRHLEMSVEAILAEQPDNFFVPNQQVESVEIIEDEADDEAILTQVKYTLEIATRSRKYQFGWQGKPRRQEARELLYEVLGDVVK